MNFKTANKELLVNIHMRKAAQRLKSAAALLDIGNFEDSVSRSYYAILDAATACLINKDVVPHSHAGAIKLFSLHYIKTSLVDAKYQKQFARVEKARIEADYTHIKSFTEAEVSEILLQAKEFVDMAKALIGVELQD